LIEITDYRITLPSNR